MPTNKTEAELALQRKYALLQKMKASAKQIFFEQEQKAKEAKAAASGSKSRDQDGSPAEKIDPVRQAAIEALKRKRAAAGGGATAAAAPAPAPTPAAEAPAPKAEPSKPAPTSIKLKFVIPKKNLPTGAPKPAAAKIPLKKKPAVVPSNPKLTAAAVASPITEGQPTAKRPAIRRTVPQRPASQDQAGQGLLPHSTTAAASAEGAAGAAAPPPGVDIPSVPRLFVGDLPEHFTSDTLYNFFSEFHEVEEARVVSSFCYGFVTFSSYEDAQAVLDFQAQQPIQVEDRHLRISWARDKAHDTTRPSRERAYAAENGDGQAQEHPRIRAARMAAAQVIEQQDQHALEDVYYSEAPGRNLVSYDDL